MWVKSLLSEEIGECSELSKSCSDILEMNGCNTPEIVEGDDGKVDNCSWVDDDVKCIKVRNSCEDLSGEKICLHDGAAASEGEKLNCLWLKENTSNPTNQPGRCTLEVCEKNSSFFCYILVVFILLLLILTNICKKL
jgi:hypothetical protein